MKYANLRSFEKHLTEAAPNHFSSLYLIVAKDSFARKEASDKLCEHLLAGQKKSDFSLKTFSSDQHSIEDILDELNTVSLFAPRRVFVIHQVEKYPKSSFEPLESYFLKPTKETFLVLCATSLTATTNFYKKIEKAGVILDIAEEKPWEKEKTMQGWIAEHVLIAGKKIAPQACQTLVKQCGTDQATLHQEIEKLLCYIGDRAEITPQDVAAVCPVAHLETTWQLGEAIFRRDVATALRISKGMLEEGTAFLALLRQLRSQFHTLFQITCILSTGGSSADITQQYPHMKGSILEKQLQSARTYGRQKSKEGLLLIDATELQAKNSGIDVDLLNETLMIKLAA